MKPLLTIPLLLLCLGSCQHPNKPIPRSPFEIDHNITCEQLRAQGYLWMPGVDVILWGKRTGDLLDYYQLEWPLDPDFELKEEEGELNFDTNYTYKGQEYGEFEDMEYNGNPCTNANIICRFFENKYPTTNISKITGEFNPNRYSIINIEDCLNYQACLIKFKVINRITSDTFRCRIEKDEGKLVLTSTIDIKQ